MAHNHIRCPANQATAMWPLSALKVQPFSAHESLFSAVISMSSTINIDNDGKIVNVATSLNIENQNNYLVKVAEGIQDE